MARLLGGLVLMLGFHAWLGGIIGFLFGSFAYLNRLLGKQPTPEVELMLWVGVAAFLLSFPVAWIGDRLSE